VVSFLKGIMVVSLIELILLPPIEMQTRMQGTKAKQYANTIDCFKQIVSQEGVGALYAGVVPRLGRVVPGQGIIFMSFEAIVQSLEQFSIFQ
jgi:solute carrier family 25 citrate transporter 1